MTAKVEEVGPETNDELPNPVRITITSKQELEWLYVAVSQAVHSQNVHEDSKQQKFYCRLHPELNSICAKYRNHGATK